MAFTRRVRAVGRGGYEIEMTPDVISLGSCCFVATILTEAFKKPMHVFDNIGCIPSMAAEIIADGAKKLMDSKFYIRKTARGGHIQHSWYERFAQQRAQASASAFDYPFLNDLLTEQGVPAMFQHETEQGIEWLSKKIEKRYKITKTCCDGTQWKVFVHGIPIPWKLLRGLTQQKRAYLCECVIDAELEILFNGLKQQGIDNFALVGLVVVHGVQASEKWKASEEEWALCNLVERPL